MIQQTRLFVGLIITLIAATSASQVRAIDFTALGTDPMGNVFAADRDSKKIVRYGPSGDLDAVVASGYDNIKGLAVGKNFDVYFISGNDVLKAGYGGGRNYKVSTYFPDIDARAIATDTQGRVYITTKGGYVFILEEGGGGVIDIAANVQDPRAIAVDSKGTVYVLSGPDRIFKTSDKETMLEPYITSGLRNANSLFVDSGGNLYVTELGFSKGNGRISVYNPQGRLQSQQPGIDNLTIPSTPAVHGDNVYFVESADRVMKFNRKENLRYAATVLVTGDFRGLALVTIKKDENGKAKSVLQDLFISTTKDGIRQYNTDYNVWKAKDDFHIKDVSPEWLDANSDNTIYFGKDSQCYFATSWNKYTPEKLQSSSCDDSMQICGVAADYEPNVNKVRYNVFSANGIGRSILGSSYVPLYPVPASAGQTFTGIAHDNEYDTWFGLKSGDGTGSVIKFKKDLPNCTEHSLGATGELHSIAVAKDGTLYVTDKTNGILYKLTNDGRYLGRFTENLKVPTSIVVDKDNNIYCCETGLRRILKFSPAPIPSVFASQI